MGEATRLLQDPVFHRLGLTLAHFLWEGALLAALAWGLRMILQSARPGVRYLALLTVFASMVVTPVMTFAFWAKPPQPAVRTRSWMRHLLQEGERQRLHGASAHPAEQALTPGPRSTLGQSGPVAMAAMRTWLNRSWRGVRSRLPVAALLWMVGVLLLSLRWIAQWRLFARLARRAEVVEDPRWRELLVTVSQRVGVRRAVRLLRSVQVAAPVVVGWLRPVVLLPPAVLVGLTPEQLGAVLAHELAHVRRHDYMVNVAQRVVETLLFYHPAVWWVSGQIRAAREICCDDAAVLACGDRAAYARALADLEALRWSPPEPVLAAAGGPLLARIHRLAQPNAARPRLAPSWVAAAMPVAAVALVSITPGLASLGGGLTIRGTLVYQETLTVTKVGAYQWYGTVARVLSGRSTWVVPDPLPAHMAAPSPTSDEILLWDFIDTERPQGAGDVWKSRSDGSRPVNLTAPLQIGGYNSEARWSPDGGMILFNHYVHQERPANPWAAGTKFGAELWVMKSDGSGAHRIAVPGRMYLGGSARWTANGSGVVLSAALAKPRLRCTADTCKSFFVSADGRSTATPPPGPPGLVSPDGEWTATTWAEPKHAVIPSDVDPKGWYRPADRDYRVGLALMRTDGTGRRVIVDRAYPIAAFPEDPCGTAQPLEVRDLAWSPDSTQLAFVSALDWDLEGPPANEQVEVYVYDLLTTRLTQVTHDDLEQCTPVWME